MSKGRTLRLVDEAAPWSSLDEAALAENYAAVARARCEAIERAFDDAARAVLADGRVRVVYMAAGGLVCAEGATLAVSVGGAPVIEVDADPVPIVDGLAWRIDAEAAARWVAMKGEA
jgi:hypothetical protein